MFLRPIPYRCDWFGESVAQSGKLIFNMRRYFGEDGAAHDAVAFQFAQGLGKHLLRNAIDPAPQRGKTTGAILKQANDQGGPLVGEQGKGSTGWAITVIKRYSFA
jgi:hypothetical protein